MPENDHPEKTGLHAVLFPHSGLSEEGLGRILSFFEHLTLFMPWHMDEPGIEGERSFLQVVRPPEAMKPVIGFKGLLSEYRQWMTQNDLKGYTPLLRASVGGDPREEPTTQEIREALRPGAGGRSSRETDDFTRWHLVLHLKRLMEGQEEEAGRVLAALRKGSPPLSGLVEDEETVEGLFDDLPPIESSRIEEPRDLEQVCEAWFGLFAGALRKQDPLVTLNRHLFAYLSGSWEERYGAESLDEHSVGWFWPDLSGIGVEALGRERSRVFQDDLARELRGAFQDFRKEPGGGFGKLKRASGRLDRPWVHRYSPRVLRISMRHFPRDSEGSLDPKARALGKALDRPIIHVEEDLVPENA